MANDNRHKSQIERGILVTSLLVPILAIVGCAAAYWAADSVRFAVDATRQNAQVQSVLGEAQSAMERIRDEASPDALAQARARALDQARILRALVQGDDRQDAAARSFQAVIESRGSLITARELLMRIGTTQRAHTTTAASTASRMAVAQSWLALAGALLTIGLVVTLCRRVGRELRNRRHVEADLRSANERLDQLLDGSFDGHWDWNIQSGAVIYSDRVRQLLGGFTEQEFPNEMDSFWSIMHAEDVQATRALLDDHLNSDSRYDTEFRLKCKDDEYRWFRCRGRSLRDAEGTPCRMSGAITDVHMQKASVEEMEQAARQSWHARVAMERQATELSQTAELLAEARIAADAARAAAEQARETADAANRAKSDFLANMSHEIRTPTAAIVGYADLLTEPETSPAEKLDAANTIRRNAHHLLSLINDILDLSKIEAGKMTVELLRTDVATISREAVDVVRHRCQEAGLDLRLAARDEMPQHIITDPTRLRQILVNLLGNAVKFTQQGSITFSVEMIDGHPTFHITDTGVGMSEEQVGRLFQPFTQADTSTTRKFGGTGLGLAISRKIARLLDGDLTVTSRSGSGSTFSVTLPESAVPTDTPFINPFARTASAAAPVNPAFGMANAHLSGEVQDGAGSAAKVAPLQGRRILLAEDGIDNQRLIGMFLRKAGAQLTLAENGALALEHALSSNFELILMDMQMPVMDGYTATTRIREAGKVLPIIALTAHAMAEDRNKCLAAGCTDYLTKPVDRSVLISNVARHLEQADQNEYEASLIAAENAEPFAQTTPPLQIDGSTMATNTHDNTPAGNTPPDDAAADDDLLISEYATDPDMADLVREFTDGLPQTAQKVAELAAAGDMPNLQRVAHQIKGAAGGYGFSTITAAAAKLEAALKASTIVDAKHPLVLDVTQMIYRTQPRSLRPASSSQAQAA